VLFSTANLAFAIENDRPGCLHCLLQRVQIIQSTCNPIISAVTAEDYFFPFVQLVSQFGSAPAKILLWFTRTSSWRSCKHAFLLQEMQTHLPREKACTHGSLSNFFFAVLRPVHLWEAMSTSQFLSLRTATKSKSHSSRIQVFGSSILVLFFP